MSAKALCLGAVRPPRSFVHTSGQILLPRYLVNGLSSLDETNLEGILTSSTDDMIRFWRSRSQQAVKVGKTFTSMLGHRSPSSCGMVLTERVCECATSCS